MTEVGVATEQPHRMTAIGGRTRYTRVAMYLHWAIAIMIIYNLVSGFLVWDLASAFFKATGRSIFSA
jgi:hypothetical protein